MPTVKIAPESMGLLIKEAKRVGVTVKDILDMIVMDHFGLLEGPEEIEVEEEFEQEEED